MAITKSAKIQAEIEKVKAKIVDIVRGMSVSLEELPLVLQQLRGASGHGGQKPAPVEEVTE